MALGQYAFVPLKLFQQLNPFLLLPPLPNCRVLNIACEMNAKIPTKIIEIISNLTSRWICTDSQPGYRPSYFHFWQEVWNQLRHLSLMNEKTMLL